MVVRTKPKTAEIMAQSVKQRTESIKEIKNRKRLQRRWKIKSTAQKLFGRELSSSFVSELSYYQEEMKVHVLLSNIKYTFFNVPDMIFKAWTKGAATCETDDAQKRKRWWIGKTPSLGAFFNDKIKNKYTYVRGWL